jgi:dipeptidyl-peptidase-3
LSNLVNYKSFGFTKFVPRVDAKLFEAVVECSANATEAVILWNDVRCNYAKTHIVHSIIDIGFSSKTTSTRLKPEDSLSIGKRILGNVCNYYLGQPITDEEVAAVQTAAESLNIDILNTRCVFLRVSSQSIQPDS